MADTVLVFREPLADTLRPLAAVGAADLALCAGVAALPAGLPRFLCLAGAAALSFVVAALLLSLLRRPEVLLDRAAGRLRIRRPGQGPVDLALAEVRAVTRRTVGPGVAAVGLETDGGWIPLPSGGGGAVAATLGLPLVEAAP